MKKILLSFLILLLYKNLKSQQFSNSELSVIKTSQVIIENYTVVTLSKEIIDETMANRFDAANPYTYLQVINDESGNSYHILFQTNFNGKILFLSYSNNLSALFNKRDKPMFLFTRCLKEINNAISSVQVTNTAIKCIVDRLNYCSDN
jgi:hypothetical protein